MTKEKIPLEDALDFDYSSYTDYYNGCLFQRIVPMSFEMWKTVIEDYDEKSE